MGDGRRKARVEKEVQQVVSQYLIKNLQAELPGIVTVTRVQMPADFRTAKIFVSCFSENKIKDEEILNVLEQWSRDIQNEINHSLKMRYCPKLSFHIDQTTENILKIEKILSEISSSTEKMSHDDSTEEVD